MAQKKWWFTGTVIIISLLIVWVLVLSSRQLKRSERIEKEVAILEVEAGKIRHENETLAEKIQYFSSNDFREQEAKKKLGLKKEKENVVIINPRSGSERQENKPEERVEREDNTPNYKKWWNLFF
ncbi:MAG: septum formation initiator family protein [Candidatus Moranbacteria bacterium]|nr:septum formation initiator family protein [Candidatus Moranbacteria bacterium]MDD3965034.1 septum formation initiator family protein [Candidatus Moranbacteria bacterium]